MASLLLRKVLRAVTHNRRRHTGSYDSPEASSVDALCLDVSSSLRQTAQSIFA